MKTLVVVLVIALLVVGGLYLWSPWAGVNVQMASDKVGDALKNNVPTAVVAQHSEQWYNEQAADLSKDMADVMELQGEKEGVDSQINSLEDSINENDLHIKSGIEFLKTSEPSLRVNDNVVLNREEVKKQVDLRIAENNNKRETLSKMRGIQTKLDQAVNKGTSAVLANKQKLLENKLEEKALATTIRIDEQLLAFNNKINNVMEGIGGRNVVNPYHEELLNRQRQVDAANKIMSPEATDDGLVPLASSKESQCSNTAMDYYDKHIATKQEPAASSAANPAVPPASAEPDNTGSVKDAPAAVGQ